MKTLAKTLALILLQGGAMTVFGHPVDRMIDKYDSDGDGMISVNEFQPPKSRGMMKRMDANNDGVVTMDEINQQVADHQTKMAERHAEMTVRVQAFFSDADLDGDGSVTGEEAQAAAFNRIDKNVDGYLTEQELRNAKPPYGGMHRPSRPVERGGSYGES